MKILGISGKIGSGKSYVANILTSDHGWDKTSFAAPLRRELVRAGFTWEELLDKEPWMRALLQSYGQAKRAVNPDYWVERVKEMLVHCIEEEPYRVGGKEYMIVIDDVRFENEADMLYMLEEEYDNVQTSVVRINRVRDDRDAVPGSDDPSESALDTYPDFDKVFYIPSGDTQSLRNVANALASPLYWEDLNGRAASKSPLSPLD